MSSAQLTRLELWKTSLSMSMMRNSNGPRTSTIILVCIKHFEKKEMQPYKFKTGIPQCGVLSPTLFNNNTADLPPPRAPVQVMAYADDITITYTRTSAAKKYIQPYLHKSFCLDKTKQCHTRSRQKNALCSHQILRNIRPLNKQHCTTHGNAPNGSGSYIRPKAHIAHTFTISQYTYTRLYK